MDNRFDDIFNSPDNEIFQVVFFPDRIYHARFLNASISPRYRYNVTEVRNKSDITILKGEVYLDENLLTHFMRIEYRASRLVEITRERGRILRDKVMIENMRLLEHKVSAKSITLNFSKQIQAYQVEIWQTLETTAGTSHDVKILNMMGRNGSITRLRPFSAAFENPKAIKNIEMSFREYETDLPYGYRVTNPAVDNNYSRSYQIPNRDNPTQPVNNYLISFQRGWYIDQKDVDPVTYNNALMDKNNTEYAADNKINMRWLLQRQLGGNIVYFHEVEIPPGKTEGTHQHLGSEEVYYFYEGEGEVYMAAGDDPAADHFPDVERQIYQLDNKQCKALPAYPGITIYTKSGGIHGIKNTSDKPLKFVAFGYHCS